MRFKGVYIVMLLVALLGCSAQDEHSDSNGWVLGPEVTFEVEGESEGPNNTSSSMPPGTEEEGPTPPTEQIVEEQVQDPVEEPTPPIEQPIEEQIQDPVEEPAPTTCMGTLRTVISPAEVEGTLPSGLGAVSERGCAIAHGNEHAYTLRVNRAGGVKIWTTWRGGETLFSPVLTLSAGCDERSPTYCSSPLSSGPSAKYSGYIQAHLEPGDYVLTIDETSIDAGTSGGDYVLHIEDVQLAEHAMCESAMDGVPPLDWFDRFAGDGTTAPLESCFSEAVHAHYYSFVVSPRTALTVMAEYIDPPVGSRQPWLKIARGCHKSAEMCAGVTGVGVVSLVNESEEHVIYTVAVDGLEDVEYILRPLYR